MGSSYRQIWWEWRVVAISTPTIAVLVIFLRFLGFLQFAEWISYDQFMQLRPPAQQDDRIALIGFDEEDYARLGTAQVSDLTFAELIETLKAQNPRAIGLDFYRNFPVEPGSEQLNAVFRSTPNLIGIQKVAGDPVLPSPVLAELGQVGSNDVVIDGDNTVRRGLLTLATPEGQELPSFGLFLSLIYLQPEGIQIEVLPNGRDWKLGQAIFSSFKSNDGGYIQADAKGSQILINYRGPSYSFERVSFQQVLDRELPPNWATDRIVLIGPFAEADKDFFYTPYSADLMGEAQRMYGVEIHANIISQILSAALDGRPLIRSWSEPLEWLWILFWSGIGASAAWIFRKGGKDAKIQRIKELGSLILTLVLLFTVTFILFCQGWWIPFVPPFVAILGSTVAVTGYLAQSARNIRKTFGRYLSDEIVETLLESPEGLKLGGERRCITILTSDLRGFTAMSERLPPEEVIKILNFYLGHMADVITEYGGTIDEFMGDGILVLFGAPTGHHNDPQQAVACAIAMQLAMEDVNQQMTDWNYPTLEMGIGINTGEVVVGNIGSVKRTKYGVVGSQVNLTYRIESYTTGGEILISETTRAAIDPTATPLKIEGEKQVQPKGVKQPITIYSIGGIGAPYHLFLDREEEVFVTLATPIPIQYAILSGKDVSDKVFKGYLSQLSRKQALVQLEQPEAATLPTGLANIKLNLLPCKYWSALSEDIYAKVLDTPAAQGSFYIYFTARPPKIAQSFQEIYQNAQDCPVPA